MNIQQPTSNIQRRTRSARRSLLGALAVGLVLSSVAQTNTNSAASGNEWPAFDSFSVIQRNNVFDPNRRPWIRETNPGPKRPALEGFALRGTMSYAKGKFAFFDGTGDEYNKVLGVGGNIAGYTVKDITQDDVTLAANGKDFKLPVGRQVRKQNGNWQMGRPIEATNDETNSSGDQTEGTPSSDPSAPPATANSQQSEVLKRLMAAKEQELKELK
jgi:hypothetical protein